MSWVKARPGESIDNLLKRFKKVVERSGILSDYKKHERYEKPSVKRKRKQAAAIKRAAKAKKKLERFQKPKQASWKWNKDRTKKIPLRNNYKPGTRPTNSQNKGRNPSYKNNNKPRVTHKRKTQ